MRIIESENSNSDGRDPERVPPKKGGTNQSSHLRSPTSQVAFTRTELSIILSVYGQFVGAGEWRDYAIDCMKDVAVFSIFRRASEAPLYRIEKRPKLARRQGV